MRSIDELSVNDKMQLHNSLVSKRLGSTDIDWSDIVEQFDLDVHPDTLRRAAIGSCLAQNVFTATAHSDNAYVERQKSRDLTRQINSAYRAQSRSELLRETVEDAVSKLEPIHFNLQPQDVKPATNAKSLVVGLGDLHYGADWECKGLYGETLNMYNSEEFDKRMQELLCHIAHIVDRERPRDVYLMLVGDLIDGILRQSQLSRIECGLVDQTIRLSEYLAEWLSKLDSYLTGHPMIHVSMVTGNHSEIRPCNTKARELAEENLERIIGWYLVTRLKDNPNIIVDEDVSRMKMVAVEGYSFCLLHGDGEKNITDIAKQTINLYQQPVDVFMCGHLHRLESYPTGMTSDGTSQIIRVPSLCGMDTYAQSKGYGGRAGAVALVVAKKYGILCQYPIMLKKCGDL